ncbi:hypothetical protein ES319_1Z205100v1 [Gossypium barbadense]|uniref:Uncharacterized protein n=1 Tax=Gossypium barbadense TaxID=3634 RepID=A0A5J5NBU4_GOSBA|nr:hypothetical protein ES319_1Z205100v1 [Gossypium barbadense]
MHIYYPFLSLSVSWSPSFVFFFFLIYSVFITNPQIYLFNPNLFPFLYRFSLSVTFQFLSSHFFSFGYQKSKKKKNTHTLHCFLWFLKPTASSGTDFEWVHFSAVYLFRFL